MHTEYREYRPFTAPQRETYVNDNEEIDGVKARDLRVFVGQNAHYYLPRFKKMCNRETSVSWNWAAFFFGFNWLCYRKMYKFACLYIILDLILAIVLYISNQISSTSSLE